MTRLLRATPISERRFRVAESPIWDDRRKVAYFVDIKGHRVLAYDPADGSLADWSTGEDVGFVALTEGNNLVLGLKSGLAAFDPRKGVATPLGAFRCGVDERINDGKVDSQGRLWFGTMKLDAAPGGGALWRLAPGENPVRVRAGYGVPNGPAFARDGSFYHSATDAGRIDIHDADGRPLRILATLAPDEGKPDGLAVDSAGRVWCGLWGGGGLTVIDPETGSRQHVPIEATYVTALAPIGDDGRALLVTAADLPIVRGEPALRRCEGAVFHVALDFHWPARVHRFAWKG